MKTTFSALSLLVTLSFVVLFAILSQAPGISAAAVPVAILDSDLAANPLLHENFRRNPNNKASKKKVVGKRAEGSN